MVITLGRFHAEALLMKAKNPFTTPTNHDLYCHQETSFWVTLQTVT